MFNRVLIVGGNGMLASAIAHALSARQIPFVAVDIGEFDITRPQDVQRMFAAHRPTLLFNCAAHTRVDQCEREPERANAINAQAVRTLAEHCRAFQTKLVHFGTDFIFDGRAVRPYRPDDPPNPLGAYGRSKLLGETEMRRINPPGWLILRLAWLYGENGACFPQTILNVARQGKPLRVVDDQIGSPTYTRDVAEIAIALVERNASGIFHAVNSGMASWFEFTRAILDEFAVAADLSPQTSAQWKASHSDAAERPAYSVLDISATERVLGRPIRSWREALHEYRMNALPQPTPAP